MRVTFKTGHAHCCCCWSDVEGCGEMTCVEFDGGMFEDCEEKLCLRLVCHVGGE